MVPYGRHGSAEIVKILEGEDQASVRVAELLVVLDVAVRVEKKHVHGPGVSGTIVVARDIAHAGYEVRARRPRVAGYPDLVSPDRARTIEDTVREYDGFFDD